jgi:hypothetical protein
VITEYRLSDFVQFIDNNPDNSLEFFQLLLITQNITDMNAYTHSISCWHENQGESDAMWALYAGSEVRIIATTLDGYESSDPTRYYIDFSKPVPPGVYIECDIYSLIEEVVVSPLMPLYAFQAIEDMTSRVLSRRIPIRRSTLLAKEDTLSPSRELAAMLEQYRRTGLSGLR